MHFILPSPQSKIRFLFEVWGPESIRLGFIGAPIATVISFYLVSLVSLLFGIYYVPRKGWHPITSQMFTNLGVVTSLGISGIGKA